jgi:prepilin signal peptidase PulO-like enzyme (type II secretory pathway)
LAIGAGNAFLLAALTDFLQFRRDHELAVYADVEAGVAGVVEFIGDKRAGVVAGCEAGFAAAALWVVVA